MGKKSQSKKRHSIGSNVINSVLNSEISKSIFQSNNKRKFRDINTPGNLQTFMNTFSNSKVGMKMKEKEIAKEKDDSNGGDEMLN